MLVVGIGTMALIIVLSVFNGLEGLLRSTYGSFDAEVIVSATQGKSFVYTDDLKAKIESSEAVDLIAEVIEDNVLIKYKNAQRVVRMKGVSETPRAHRSSPRHSARSRTRDWAAQTSRVGALPLGRARHFS